MAVLQQKQTNHDCPIRRRRPRIEFTVQKFPQLYWLLHFKHLCIQLHSWSEVQNFYKSTGAEARKQPDYMKAAKSAVVQMSDSNTLVIEESWTTLIALTTIIQIYKIKSVTLESALSLIFLPGDQNFRISICRQS